MVIWILSCNSYAQSVGAYRSIASGDFDQIGIWEVYDGALWNAASTKPDKNHDVYIEFGHKVTLQQNESVHSLFLNAQTSTGEKLDINDFQLEVYGSLNAFSGSAPGTAVGTWNTIDWIGSSEVSELIFKGNSRVIIPSGAWSGFTTRSRYAVIFDPNPGAELTIQEPIKANRFVIKSGTVIQEGIPGMDCATFSFNNDPAVTGAYGELIIESGGTLETDCGEEIIMRSVAGLVPALLLDLEEGASLVLNANDPEIDAVSINFAGTVIYNSNSGTQHFVTSNIASSANPESYQHIVFDGNASKELPNNLEVAGNITRSGGGAIVDNNTDLSFTGTTDQSVSGFALDVTNLDLNKSMGVLEVDQDINVKSTLMMTSGELDFNGNNLSINTTGLGGLVYLDGSWSNLNLLEYNNLPCILTTSNATFPFVDKYEGGVRALELTGMHTALTSGLNITYQQLPGVDHSANFLDSDGTLILYQLNSYFSFSGLAADNSDLILRISADDLIVDNVDDLRVVADHQAAEGDHMSGETSGGQLWARREVSLSELNGNDFTIGSYIVATILPITWVNYTVKANGKNNLVEWAVSSGEELSKYHIYRSEDNVDNFRKLESISVNDFVGGKGVYQFFDQLLNEAEHYYYQIGAVDKWGEETFSPVFGLQRSDLLKGEFHVFPNPYLAGNINFDLPIYEPNRVMTLIIKDAQGIEIAEYSGKIDQITNSFAEKLKSLRKGFYIISCVVENEVFTEKWIKQ
ncbi:T9SS type A sorting domain-containing protein [Echinicola sp. CAU 1574]|uniref:T9SS type A sorting domain-containing protein n=1 Tax=Echinicola arenosa TaxID=2774144 RepID=A0ABR9ARQ1_9BACT|nr:T9SS type A sorting domain-containing protein [Echinicola arenosa]MBD8491046.1 T9SS type A sorting domain-containing protein [Echinicola arenosa]